MCSFLQVPWDSGIFSCMNLVLFVRQVNPGGDQLVPVGPILDKSSDVDENQEDREVLHPSPLDGEPEPRKRPHALLWVGHMDAEGEGVTLSCSCIYICIVQSGCVCNEYVQYL